MMQPIIRAEHLAKQYQLGARARHLPTFRETIRDLAAAPWRRFRNLSGRGPMENTFWALDDVSFELAPGEALGIIGRNGAGKSTLLKVLSRITEPTRGRAVLHGRVSSLLEVGTGFHPELSGRENIYLNGAILGMTRAEIKRKFDEIVAFAEVERFLDTQVKHYSSGMYVRLAFAVAAHLEPEIFIVDEVLAVGDAAFQNKCLGKMDDVARAGRTVIFVSHHMPSVNRLCRRGLLLEAGRIKADGDIHTVSSRYLQSNLGTSAARQWDDPRTAPGDDVARLAAVRVRSQGVVCDAVDIRFPVSIEMEYYNRQPGAILAAAFTFFNDQGAPIFVASTRLTAAWRPTPLESGLYRAVCVVPGNLLSEGMVRVAAEVSTVEPAYQIHLLEYDSVAFQVVDSGEPGSVRMGWGRPLVGAVRPQLDWDVCRLPADDVAAVSR